MKCAVFSCLGLGDGLLSMVLSHNLKENGHEVTTFHPMLHQMSDWFPGQTLRPFPQPETLSQFERFFIFYEKTPHMQLVLNACLENYRHTTTVLNPIATANKDYPYWEEGQFNGAYSLLDNLVTYCKTVLHLANVSKGNGISAPKNLLSSRLSQRVIVHPTSSKEEKNWPRDKYLQLAARLKDLDYLPVFVMSESEKAQWGEDNAKSFSSLSDLAAYINESSYFIGNDSGIGHLASCLGLPTLTICRNFQTARFWRPAWSQGKILYPSHFIPNIKYLRLRDHYWKKWISVNSVMKSFLGHVSER